jgi:hypothetical protein
MLIHLARNNNNNKHTYAGQLKTFNTSKNPIGTPGAGDDNKNCTYAGQLNSFTDLRALLGPHDRALLVLPLNMLL